MKLFNLLFIFSALIIASCSEPEQRVSENEDYKTVEDFYYLGDIHNEYMMNLASNFIGQKGVDKIEALEYLNSVNLQFEPSDLTFNDAIKSSLDNPVLTLDTAYISSNLRGYFSSNSTVDRINTLYNYGKIDSWEKDLLLEFITFSEENTSFESLKSFIDGKIDIRNSRNYLANSSSGNITGIFLAIAKQSTEWWLSNPEYVYNPNLRLPVWFFADAVGAIAGGLVADHFGASDEGVVGSMVAGAITGSTGIVGKVGRWLHGVLIP